LAAFRYLIQPGRQISYGELVDEKDLTGPTGSTRVWVDDVNADGKLDVLVGDSVHLSALPKGLSKEEFQKKQAEWNQEQTRISQEYQAAAEDPKKLQEYSEKIQKLYAQRSEFILEDSTGFVWVYLQK
jgi:hypothetical protein